MKRSLFAILFILTIQACRPKQVEENSHFPPAVQIIFTNKCATAGCHNKLSAGNAANLDMSSFESLLNGSVNGSVIIPFSPSQSSLIQFVNTYADLGLTANPSMPLNDNVLTRSEVISIQEWVKQGCPNHEGYIPFSSNASSRGKTYISNQGCDLVSVIDNETNMVMRSVRVGKDPGIIEQPHNIKVSHNGKFWYVCFSNGSIIQKFSADNDSLIAEVDISSGKWNVILLTLDDQTAFVSDFSSDGRIVELDLNSMTVKKVYASGLFSNPHGLASSQTGDTVYATAQYGNMIYRIIRSIPQVDNISLQKGVSPMLTPNLLDPHEVIMSPDFSRYFVTCEASDEIRVVDSKTDTLITSIPVGDFPLEMAISKKRNLLFVTCQEDNNTLYPFFKGSVYVIDMNTLSVVRKISEKFYQPHGLAIDDQRNFLYVASTNASVSGPAPHHVSECSGRNGFFHVIDLNTWKSVKPSSELSVFPYSVSIRE